VNSLHRIVSYLRHKLKAKGTHGIHSPFVFNLLTHVLPPSGKYYCFDAIEEIRETLLRVETTVEVSDLGAGASARNKSQRKISSIANVALKPNWQAQFLFRLAYHFKPKHTLELGTSLGLTTAYLASANRSGEVFTIEGSPKIQQLALKHFGQLEIFNINSRCGSFSDVLPGLLNEMKEVDFIFMDGNHRCEPTLNYLKAILPFCSNAAVIVVDDIYWSKEMTEAWKKIIALERVQLSLDFYYMGVVFIEPRLQKEHFCLRWPG